MHNRIMVEGSVDQAIVKESEVTPSNELMEVTVNPIDTLINADHWTRRDDIEETFFMFCTQIIESSGDTTTLYSHLSTEELAKLRENPEPQPENDSSDKELEAARMSKISKLVNRNKNHLIENSEDTIIPYSHLSTEELAKLRENPEPQPENDLSDKELEAARMSEISELVNRNKDHLAIIRDVESSINPFGENLDDVEVTFLSDLHHAPGNRTSIRAEVYRKYPDRLPMAIIDQLKHFKRFGLTNLKPSPRSKETHDIIEQSQSADDNDPDYHVKRYIMREDMLRLFKGWVGEVFSNFTHESSSTQILISLGDIVHDGGTNLDLSTELASWIKLVENASDGANNKPHISFLAGNHDHDSRKPESLKMQSEIFGHNIYTQEVGNVLLATVDTNIMSSSWRAEFHRRAGAEARKTLSQRDLIQDSILERIKNHDGSVVLVGHHPGRLIKMLVNEEGMKNVKTVIAGHIHQEGGNKVEFPDGRKVELHTITSMPTVTMTGNPVPSKISRLRIKDKKISQVETVQEPLKRYEQRYEEEVNLTYLT